MKDLFLKIVTSLLIALTAALPINEGPDSFAKRSQANLVFKRDGHAQIMPLAESLEGRGVEVPPDDDNDAHGHGQGWP
jgi:hypothetical protein